MVRSTAGIFRSDAWRGGRLVRFRAAERGEELAHRLLRRGGKQKIDRREHLVIHAPAIVDMEVGARLDDLCLGRFVPERRPKAAAEIDPVEREDHVRVFDGLDCLRNHGIRSRRSGMQRMIGREAASDLEVADDLGIERLGERHPLVPGMRLRETRPMKITGLLAARSIAAACAMCSAQTVGWACGMKRAVSIGAAAPGALPPAFRHRD